MMPGGDPPFEHPADPRKLRCKITCASVPTTSEEAQIPSFVANISFSVGA